jgi:hypothetical protein
MNFADIPNVSNISDFYKDLVLNPFFFTVILFGITVVLLFFAFDNLSSNSFYSFIKFFIYYYAVFVVVLLFHRNSVQYSIDLAVKKQVL